MRAEVCSHELQFIENASRFRNAHEQKFPFTLGWSVHCALSSVRIEYRIPIPLVVGSNPSGRAKRKVTVKVAFSFACEQRDSKGACKKGRRGQAFPRHRSARRRANPSGRAKRKVTAKVAFSFACEQRDSKGAARTRGRPMVAPTMGQVPVASIVTAMHKPVGAGATTARVPNKKGRRRRRPLPCH